MRKLNRSCVKEQNNMSIILSKILAHCIFNELSGNINKGGGDELASNVSKHMHIIFQKHQYFLPAH